MEVTLDSIFGELLEEYPETEEVLKDYLGQAYCLVCPGKMFDTIGNGVLLHGLTDEHAAEMVDDLQVVVDAYEEGKTEDEIRALHEKRREAGTAAIGAATAPYVMPGSPAPAATGHHANDGHDHAGHRHDDGDELSPEDIDTSTVNIDHMFQAAMMESMASEAEDEFEDLADAEDDDDSDKGNSNGDTRAQARSV
jgi:hypothetical protein